MDEIKVQDLADVHESILKGIEQAAAGLTYASRALCTIRFTFESMDDMRYEEAYNASNVITTLLLKLRDLQEGIVCEEEVDPKRLEEIMQTVRLKPESNGKGDKKIDILLRYTDVTTGEIMLVIDRHHNVIWETSGWDRADLMKFAFSEHCYASSVPSSDYADPVEVADAVFYDEIIADERKRAQEFEDLMDNRDPNVKDEFDF